MGDRLHGGREERCGLHQTIPFATHGTVAYLALPGLTQWPDPVVPR